MGELVQQRGLPGVGVAGDCNCGNLATTTFGTFGLTRGGHRGQVSPKARHPRADTPAVRLQLRLARAPGTDASAGAASASAGLQIGRASCRERGAAAAGAGAWTSQRG